MSAEKPVLLNAYSFSPESTLMSSIPLKICISWRKNKKKKENCRIIVLKREELYGKKVRKRCKTDYFRCCPPVYVSRYESSAHCCSCVRSVRSVVVRMEKVYSDKNRTAVCAY